MKATRRKTAEKGGSSRGWTHEDYLSFVALCKRACEVEVPTLHSAELENSLRAIDSSRDRLRKLDRRVSTSSGLISNLLPVRRPQPFRDVAGAHGVLQQHPIYRKLNAAVPEAFKCIASVRIAGTAAEFRFLRVIVEFMATCPEVGSRKSGQLPADKEREKDIRALMRIADRVASIGARFETTAQAEMLEHLIATAQRHLGPGRKRLTSGPKKPGLALRSLAYDLAQQFAINSATLLRQIAAATGISLPERNAQRYCDEAMKRAPKPVLRDLPTT